MKRRTVRAIARKTQRARYKGGLPVQSRYGLKKRKLLAGFPYPYTVDDCPGHIASRNPKICERCGTRIESLLPPPDYENPEF